MVWEIPIDLEAKQISILLLPYNPVVYGNSTVLVEAMDDCDDWFLEALLERNVGIDILENEEEISSHRMRRRPITREGLSEEEFRKSFRMTKRRPKSNRFLTNVEVKFCLKIESSHAYSVLLDSYQSGKNSTISLAE